MSDNFKNLNNFLCLDDFYLFKKKFEFELEKYF